jgi:hypothetical protein
MCPRQGGPKKQKRGPNAQSPFSPSTSVHLNKSFLCLFPRASFNNMFESRLHHMQAVRALTLQKKAAEEKATKVAEEKAHHHHRDDSHNVNINVTDPANHL